MVAANPYSPPPEPPAARAARLTIKTASDAGLLARVLAQFSKRGHVPRAVSSRHVVNGAGGDHLSMRVETGGLDPGVIAHIARCLEQIPGVRRVRVVWLDNE